MKRPHIVIFNPDQWRSDVMGHMGNPAAYTPVLDRWVESEAVSFSNAFCQNTVCTPSRCSFMSGWYPHVRGHRTMFHMMQPDEPVLLRTLKEQGYFVWWGGKNDLAPGQDGPAAFCDVYHIPSDARAPHGRYTGRMSGGAIRKGRCTIPSCGASSKPTKKSPTMTVIGPMCRAPSR